MKLAFAFCSLTVIQLSLPVEAAMVAQKEMKFHVISDGPSAAHKIEGFLPSRVFATSISWEKNETCQNREEEEYGICPISNDIQNNEKNWLAIEMASIMEDLGHIWFWLRIFLVAALLRFGNPLKLALQSTIKWANSIVVNHQSSSESNSNNSSESSSSSTVQIRGLSSAIPTVDGVPGYRMPTPLICRYLRAGGIHNPKTGKAIQDDWATRNLHIGNIAYGHGTNVFDKIATAEELAQIKVQEESSERDLAYRAFDDALAKANTRVEDLDALLYISCTETGAYFNEGACHWYERYPTLSKRLRVLFLPNGCPALVHALQLANDMLQGSNGKIGNVAIVVSNSTSRYATEQSYQVMLEGNNMERWLNGCIFGDAAFSCIVSTSTMNMPPVTYRLVDVDIVCEPTVVASRFTDENGVDIFTLNKAAPKAILPSLKFWQATMLQRYGYTFDSFQHIAFHQANPKVLHQVCEYYGCLDKTSLIGEKYGNLVGASVGCALHHRLEKSPGVEAKQGDKILGYAVGALTGNSHGIFILECEVHQA